MSTNGYFENCIVIAELANQRRNLSEHKAVVLTLDTKYTRVVEKDA